MSVVIEFGHCAFCYLLFFSSLVVTFCILVRLCGIGDNHIIFSFMHCYMSSLSQFTIHVFIQSGFIHFLLFAVILRLDSFYGYKRKFIGYSVDEVVYRLD